MTSLTVTEMDSIKSPDVGHFFFFDPLTFVRDAAAPFCAQA